MTDTQVGGRGESFFLYSYRAQQGLLASQSSTIGGRMRAILILNILILVLGLGYGFRVNDVLDALGGVVQETQRQSDVNDNIPAVFAATLGASLIANAVLNGPPDTLNKIGNIPKSSR